MKWISISLTAFSSSARTRGGKWSDSPRHCSPPPGTWPPQPMICALRVTEPLPRKSTSFSPISIVRSFAPVFRTGAAPLPVELIHPRRAKPFHRDSWLYEEKYDGWRIIAAKDGGRVRLVSRRGRDHTTRFADVAAAIARLSARTLILFMAFDCLRLHGRDLRPRPLRDRRKANYTDAGKSPSHIARS